MSLLVLPDHQILSDSVQYTTALYEPRCEKTGLKDF